MFEIGHVIASTVVELSVSLRFIYFCYVSVTISGT